MRSAFMYGDIRPRVYFARGPDVYYDSRYIQAIFNTILDAFPMVHRKSRYMIDVIRSSKEETLFIYDYSSFTSTLHEIRNFTSALARYFDDTYVYLFDTHFGIVPKCVGEMLDDFNNTCNLEPVFDTWKFGDLSDSEGTHQSHNCGMLGVPGNISSCTLLHGLHLAILVLAVEACRCVGDDAIGSKLLSDLYTFVLRLQNCGRVSLPKTVFWEYGEKFEEAGWHYTKRPVTRVENRVLYGFQAIFPPIASLFCVDDSFHTSFYPESVEGRNNRAVRFLQSFCLQFSSLPSVGESDIEFANNFLQCCKVGIDRWCRNSADKASSTINLLRRIPADVSYDSFEDLIVSYRYSVVTLPVSLDFETSLDPSEILVRNVDYQFSGSRALTIGEDLFWLESEELVESVLLQTDDDLDRYRSFILGLSRSLYRVTFLESSPSWYLRFFKELYSSPSVHNAKISHALSNSVDSN